MKKMFKVVAFILALSCLFSVTAFANYAGETSEDKFEPGKVLVGFKSGLVFEQPYESYLPELDIVEYREIDMEIRMWLVVILAEKTEQAVLDAIEALEDNPYVEHAEPNWLTLYIPEAVTPGIDGDINGDGEVSNVDLISGSRYLVGMEKLDEAQFARADVNDDSEVTNADLIAIAQMIVS